MPDSDKSANAPSLSLDDHGRELVARQAEAVSKVGQARAEFEKIKAGLLRNNKIPIQVIRISCW
jgi:hypothetical protein